MDSWTLLQLADSALPTGGFAHSGGLEAAMQLRRCRSAKDLARFIEEALWNSGSSALPFVAAGFAAPERFAELDQLCDAAIPSHVANRASRAQGQAFLRAVSAARPIEIGPLSEQVQTAELAGHLAPVFGVCLARLGASPGDAGRLFLFQGARGILSAGVRLGVVGPFEGQEILARVGEVAERVRAAAAERTLDDVASTSPLLEILQGHQDRLYSRLFRS